MTYIVRSRDRYAVFEWMPAHMQDLLVEVDLVRISLLLHSRALTSRSRCWAASSRIAFLVRWSVRGACSRIDGRWNTNLFLLER